MSEVLIVKLPRYYKEAQLRGIKYLDKWLVTCKSKVYHKQQYLL